MTSLAGTQEVGRVTSSAAPEGGHAVRKVRPLCVSCTEVSGVRRKRIQRLPRGGAGSMGQSGRVRRGSPGGHGPLVGPRPKPGRSPPACPRSPDIRSAIAPRRSSATSRPTPHSRTRSCSREAERVAVSGSSAWMCGGSWNLSPLPAYRSASLSPSAPGTGLGVLARTWGQKLSACLPCGRAWLNHRHL